MATKITLNPLVLLGGDDEIGLVRSALDTETCKSHPNGLQVLDSGVCNAKLGAGDRRETDKGADLDVIRSDAVRRAAQRTSALNPELIRTNPFDRCAHGDEEAREILDVGLAGRVPQDGDALRRDRRHERILGTGDTGLVQENVGATELLRAQVIRLAEVEASAQLL